MDSALNEVYAERNAIALAFAAIAADIGWPVGLVVDSTEPDWPVLMVDTPQGQVSWHFRRSELPDGIPSYPGEWDGHETSEKYTRLRRLVDGSRLGR